MFYTALHFATMAPASSGEHTMGGLCNWQGKKLPPKLYKRLYQYGSLYGSRSGLRSSGCVQVGSVSVSAVFERENACLRGRMGISVRLRGESSRPFPSYRLLSAPVPVVTCMSTPI